MGRKKAVKREGQAEADNEGIVFEEEPVYEEEMYDNAIDSSQEDLSTDEQDSFEPDVPWTEPEDLEEPSVVKAVETQQAAAPEPEKAPASTNGLCSERFQDAFVKSCDVGGTIYVARFTSPDTSLPELFVVDKSAYQARQNVLDHLGVQVVAIKSAEMKKYISDAMREKAE
jgi:hypothetical protein